MMSQDDERYVMWTAWIIVSAIAVGLVAAGFIAGAILI